MGLLGSSWWCLISVKKSEEKCESFINPQIEVIIKNT